MVFGQSHQQRSIKPEIQTNRSEVHMKKDHIRDYATEAFRFYAKAGGYEQYVRNLVEDMQKNKGSGVCNPTESALITKERIIEKHAAELADIEAVEKVLRT